MADSENDKVIQLGDARHRKSHERKEQKLEQLRDRFTKAMGMEEKPVKKGALWRLKQKKKNKPDKPGPKGW